MARLTPASGAEYAAQNVPNAINKTAGTKMRITTSGVFGRGFGGLRILNQTDNARQHAVAPTPVVLMSNVPSWLTLPAITIPDDRTTGIGSPMSWPHRAAFTRDHRTINWDFFTRLNAHNGAFLDLINPGFEKPILGFGRAVWG